MVIWRNAPWWDVDFWVRRAVFHPGTGRWIKTNQRRWEEHIITGRPYNPRGLSRFLCALVRKGLYDSVTKAVFYPRRDASKVVL